MRGYYERSASHPIVEWWIFIGGKVVGTVSAGTRGLAIVAAADKFKTPDTNIIHAARIH